MHKKCTVQGQLTVTALPLPLRLWLKLLPPPINVDDRESTIALPIDRVKRSERDRHVAL
jgi:hypothetical protein